MKLQDQVVSLELSKKLKELGVKQESEFVWLQVFNPAGWILCESNRPCVNLEEDFRAYTVAELGEMLPHIIKTPSPDGYREQIVTTYRRENDWLASAGLFYEVLADTEADTRAKMLIHLIGKGIVKL